MRKTGWFIGVALWAMGSTLEAQTCLGLTSFADAPVRVTGAQLFPSGNTNASTVALGAGRTDNVFLSLGYARITHDESELFAEDDPNEQQALFELGYQIPMAGGRLQLCPVAGAGLGKGPIIATTDYRRKFATAGMAAGVELNLGFGIRVAPNASVRWEYLRTTGDGASLAQSGGVADVGLGVVIARRIVIQPTYSLPFATGADEDAIVGVLVSLGLGRRSR